MPNPIYQVIYEDLTVQISGGALAPEARIPSESELADRYGVSRMTVRQALKRMEDERLVVRRRGAGTFVASPQGRFRTLNRLGPFESEVGLDRGRVSTKLLFREAMVPPDEVRDLLVLKPKQQAIFLSRLRLIEGSPAALQQSWIPYALAPGLVRDELVGGSLYRTLSERYGVAVQWAEQEIAAVLADEEKARLLELELGAPLTANTRLTYGESAIPIELAHGWTVPEFPFVIRLEA